MRLEREMDVALHAVRRVGDAVEIEVALSQPLPPTGRMRPTLHIGDEVARRSRAGEGGRLDRLVFSVPLDQFERMPQGAEIVVHAGLASNVQVAVKPRLADREVSL